MEVGLIVGCVVAGVIVLLAIIIAVWWIVTMNKIRQMNIVIDESASGIDVALTKRYELLTKQLDIVKGYNKHEAETLLAVVQARNSALGKKDPQSLSKLDEQMAVTANKLNVIVEQYPDLKANSVFIQLTSATTDCEEHLQAARRTYNNNVSLYNQKIIAFPDSIVAKAIKAAPREFYKVAEERKADVKMEF